MVRRVPKRMLVHEFEYHEYLQEDRNHKPKYADPVTVKDCRIDFATIYSRDSSEKKIVADCLIFCYNAQTSPFLAFKEMSKIVVSNREMIIKKVVPIYEPYTKKLFSYELECL
ncbi:minor capsid protein [Streptococcus suis]|nr:minor capsid protein [Streptococcus suis]NQQ71116.1 minor capsid protein [Streptococcus suis]HEM5582653.1 minor capsid protein [Streptococcus suis]